MEKILNKKSLTKEIIDRTECVIARNYSPLEIVIEKASGSYVYDVEGRRYLDMLSSYSALNHGHLNEEIINAIIDQMKKVTLTSRAFYNNELYKLGEKISEITDKDKILPMNSGAEAVETALKIIRKWGYIKKKIPENKAEIIVFENNFHGRTITIISFSSVQQYKKGFGPLTEGFKIVKYNDIDALKDAITENTAGILIEPIQGEGGIIVPDDGYLKQIEKICKENNILFAVDEIQTGLGRTGKMFAYQYDNVDPDIVIIGKALGGGIYPVSAVACNKEIMDVIQPGDHGSTFGGNPLASVVGVKSIEIIQRENYPEKAKIMGDYIINTLKNKIGDKVKEIRGKGLLIGIELYENKKYNAKYCCSLLKEKGVLCKDTREFVIRLAPPLIIDKKDVDFALEKIVETIDDVI